MSRMIIDRTDDTPIEVPPGLARVVVADTALGEVRGKEGFYHYRQHSAIELARTAGVEEVWHLLLHGRLPNVEELADFEHQAQSGRHHARSWLELLLAGLSVSQTTALLGDDPMVSLRTLISAYGGALALPAVYDQTPHDRVASAVRIGAAAPALLAAAYRLRRGKGPITRSLQMEANQGFCADYLYQLSGRMPTPEHVAALQTYLIAAIDHGLNASTFTARVIASTGADLAACLTGALGALSGPLHGGAPSRALAALDEIKTIDRIEPWVRNRIESGGRIMGFGHPIYRTEDPRSALLKEFALSFGGPRVELAVEMERQVLTLLAELKPGRELHTNVEFYAAVVMEHCGIPAELFTPTFAIARLLGWTAQVLEQAADPKIIRPSARYVGPTPPVPVPPLADR